MSVREIAPGVWHWAAPHPNLGGTPVSSYWLETGGVLIDPLVPQDVGMEWFASRAAPPAAVVLTNRHHYRDSDAFHERFGVGVMVPAKGMHAFSAGQPVVAYEPLEQLPGGLTAVEVGALSPDDGGLHLADADNGVLWLADTIVRAPNDPDAPIGWVIDGLMDDPPATKQELLRTFSELLDRFDFRHLALAHGLPVIGDGRERLEQFVQEGGRTAVEAFPG